MTAGSGVSAVTAEVRGQDIPGGVQNPACQDPAVRSAVCNEDRFIVGRRLTVNGTADVLGRSGIAADTHAGDVNAGCLHVRGTATVAGRARVNTFYGTSGRVMLSVSPSGFAGRLRRRGRRGAALLDAFLALAVFAVLATAVALWLDHRRQRDLQEEAGRQGRHPRACGGPLRPDPLCRCARDILGEWRAAFLCRPADPGHSAGVVRRAGCDAPGTPALVSAGRVLSHA